MTVLERLASTIAQLVADDPRRILLGEDVATGGVLGLARVVADDANLAQRVIPTPLVPTIVFAHAAGLALAGQRPVVLLPSASALLEGMAGLLEVAALGRRSGGERVVPLLVVAPCGSGFGLADEPAETCEGILSAIPGLRVVCVGQAQVAESVLRDEANFNAGEGPTVLLVPRSVLLAEVRDGDDGRGPDGAEAVRRGAAVTVFTWGECLATTLAAVERSGTDATVVDVGCLRPLAQHTIVEAARDTGKIAIVHSGPASHGLGAELAAMLARDAIYWLDAPILRICGDDVPMSGHEPWRAQPTVDQIAAGLHELTAD